MRLSIRWTLVAAYWSWLTSELLLSNPWVLYGHDIAESPPVETHTTWISFVIHMGTFVVLALLLAWANEEAKTSRWVKWMTTAVLYGGVTELLQNFVPKRYPSWEDFAANALGCLVGSVAFYFFIRRQS